uniref:Uncharacterized protein n=1 Tax=Rhizophagus irregularis (strain DAOM 181602 / DAOM 197198 / MUCL 43194) TaxID=747089 RepID=U9TAP1_RHIID
MALLSGNDYYWTKSILALKLTYFTRVLYDAVEKNLISSIGIKFYLKTEKMNDLTILNSIA